MFPPTEISYIYHSKAQTNIHIHYWIQLLCRVPQALGKGRLFAECLAGGTRHSSHLCRVSESMALGKEATFAECLTRTLGKVAVTVALVVTATFLCRVPDKVHSAKRSLPINCLPSALWPKSSSGSPLEPS